MDGERPGDPVLLEHTIVDGPQLFWQLSSANKRSAVCAECGHSCDTAYHTLVDCTTFDSQRKMLKNAIRPIINLETLIGALLARNTKRQAVSTYCKEVMELKEDRERKLELIDPVRRDRKQRRSQRKRQSTMIDNSKRIK